MKNADLSERQGHEPRNADMARCKTLCTQESRDCLSLDWCKAKQHSPGQKQEVDALYGQEYRVHSITFAAAPYSTHLAAVETESFNLAIPLGDPHPETIQVCMVSPNRFTVESATLVV